MTMNTNDHFSGWGEPKGQGIKEQKHVVGYNALQEMFKCDLLKVTDRQM